MSAANLPSIDPIPEALQRAFLSIRAKRKARKLAGIAGIISAGGLVLALMIEQIFPGAAGAATHLLLAAWPLMLAVLAISRVLAPLDAEPTPNRRTFESWVSLGHGEYESIFYPMAAISLLAPMTLHFIAYALFSFGELDFWSNFDSWITIAGALSVPAHTALVVLCHRFAKAKTEALGVVADDDGATLHALFLTGVLAAIPGAIFFLIPPVIAVLTGLFFLPPMFFLFSGLHFRERMLLDRIEAAGVRAADDEAYVRASELVLAESAAPATRAGALRFLVRRYDRERITHVIDKAISSSDPLLFRTAVIAALDIHHRPGPAEVEALVRHATGGTATHVAQLLGHYRTPLAHRTLLFLLHHGLPDVRLAAVISLGKVGDLGAIAHLRRIAVRHVSERGLVNAVDDAVRRIQDRCARGPAGALAIAETSSAAGAVSEPISSNVIA